MMMLSLVVRDSQADSANWRSLVPISSILQVRQQADGTWLHFLNGTRTNCAEDWITIYRAITSAPASSSIVDVAAQPKVTTT